MWNFQSHISLIRIYFRKTGDIFRIMFNFVTIALPSSQINDSVFARVTNFVIRSRRVSFRISWDFYEWTWSAFVLTCVCHAWMIPFLLFSLSPLSLCTYHICNMCVFAFVYIRIENQRLCYTRARILTESAKWFPRIRLWLDSALHRHHGIVEVLLEFKVFLVDIDHRSADIGSNCF